MLGTRTTQWAVNEDDTHTHTHASEDLDYDDDNSKNHNTPDKKTLDLHLLLAVVLSLSAAVSTKVFLGLSFELGAFMSGLCFARFFFINIGTLQIVFGGMLFASMGSIINVKFVMVNLALVSLIATTVYIIKFVSAFLTMATMAACGVVPIHKKTRMFEFIRVSSALTAPGELSLVFIAQAKNSNLVCRRNYLLFLTMAVFSSFINPQIHRVCFENKVFWRYWASRKPSKTSL